MWHHICQKRFALRTWRWFCWFTVDSTIALADSSLFTFVIPPSMRFPIFLYDLLWVNKPHDRGIEPCHRHSALQQWFSHEDLDHQRHGCIQYENSQSNTVKCSLKRIAKQTQDLRMTQNRCNIFNIAQFLRYPVRVYSTASWILYTYYRFMI